MNSELDPTRRLHMLLNCKNEMRVGIYNVSPAMVSLFLKHGDLGAIKELNDLWKHAPSEDFVDRMAEIAKCKDRPGMWREVEYGSIDWLQFSDAWLVYEEGRCCVSRCKNEVDMAVYTRRVAPSLAEWDYMTFVAPDLVIRNGVLQYSTDPEVFEERTPFPGPKIWAEIVEGIRLIPRWDDERQEWVQELSDSVDPATYKIPDGKVLRLPDGKVLRPPRSPPPRSRDSDPSKYKRPPPLQSSYDEFLPASSSRLRHARSPPSRPHHSGPRKYEQPSPRHSSYDKYTPPSSSRSGGKHRDYR